jgi:hypothetical protein
MMLGSRLAVGLSLLPLLPSAAASTTAKTARIAILFTKLLLSVTP